MLGTNSALWLTYAAGRERWHGTPLTQSRSPRGKRMMEGARAWQHSGGGRVWRLGERQVRNACRAQRSVGSRHM